MATKAELRHMEQVAALGCIICRRPAELHHPRKGMGLGQRNSNWTVIPLCPDHHRIGGIGVAIHAGQRTWEAKFGTEAELLEKVRHEIGWEDK